MDIRTDIPSAPGGSYRPYQLCYGRYGQDERISAIRSRNDAGHPIIRKLGYVFALP